MATGKSRCKIQLIDDQSNNTRMLGLITWAICFFTVNSEPRVTIAGGGLLCGAGRANDSNFIPLFVQTMEDLSYGLNNSNNNFAVKSIDVSTLPPVYALIQCHRDLSHSDCLVCYAVIRNAIPNCLPRTSGRYFLDGCFIRYDNYDFFHEATDPTTDTRNCNKSLSGTGWRLDFPSVVGDLVENVARLALTSSGFGVMEQKGVFGLAQCWESLSNEECRVCLNKAKKEAKGCLPGSPEGRSMNAGCFLRYSTHKFLNHDLRADASNSFGNLLLF
ncbi:hypothetical protein L6452_11823 [Arctium lappa]|uniref:Uncharacterized protein n=1 Tax=Arctium lappa TaxID=4217 RepID=A0ACB9DPH9_ARCLA|nr:hypothetical protein L6452_11823 [Arctium lappa]